MLSWAILKLEICLNACAERLHDRKCALARLILSSLRVTRELMREACSPCDSGRAGTTISGKFQTTRCTSSITIMATDYQDKIVLFGDSLTQMGWDPELRGIGARLAGTSIENCSLNRYT